MSKILVIREFDQFSRFLSENGFEVLNLPLIETNPLDDLSEFKARIEKIEKYDGIFLTSRHAA
ncbi:MAG: uroporphyrinogen-III synthase, partial [Pyrinomonadaceae bacterium]